MSKARAIPEVPEDSPLWLFSYAGVGLGAVVAITWLIGSWIAAGPVGPLFTVDIVLVLGAVMVIPSALGVGTTMGLHWLLERRRR